MLWFVGIVVLFFVFVPNHLPRLVLPWLTNGRITGQSLDPRDAWGEIWAELKARRLVATARRDGEL